MSKDIKTSPPAEDEPPATVSMLAQLGLAMLDLTSAILPSDPAARRNASKRLQRSIRRVPAGHYVQRDLLISALRALRR